MDFILSRLFEFPTETLQLYCDTLSAENARLSSKIRTRPIQDERSEIRLISSIPYYDKFRTFQFFLEHNNTFLALRFVEDWLDPQRLLRIKLLLHMNCLDRTTLNNLIGNKSKKTYRDGTILCEEVLSLTRVFHPDYYRYVSDCYNNVETCIPILADACSVPIEDVQETTPLMFKCIHAEQVARIRYTDGTLASYSVKIREAIYTRQEESTLFKILLEKQHTKVLSDPAHPILQFAIEHTLPDIKEQYPWLGNLISYINNQGKDQREFLKELLSLESLDDSYQTKCTVITKLAYRNRFNIRMINDIQRFIFNLSIHLKHQTYIKWYTKELESIQFFEEYKHQSLAESLHQLINRFPDNENSLAPKQEIMRLMTEYHQTINRMSHEK